MKLADFNKLKKLMQMTLSGNDTEALTALRHANKLILADRNNWNQVLDRVVTLEVESAPAEQPRRGDTRANQAIEEAFERVMAKGPTGTWADFISSLREQWDDKGWLSKAQLDALFKGGRS